VATEIELKLALDPRVLSGTDGVARLARHPAIVAVKHGRARTTRLTSKYYDTRDMRLARHGIALRLRHDGKRWLQTVKGPPLHGTSAGLHARSEYECRLAHASFDVAHLGTTPWHRVLLKALRKDLLVVQFTTDFVRHAIPLAFPDGTTATLAIDSGSIRAGRRTTPIAEIEMEIVTGNPLPLFGVAQRLAQDVPLAIGSANKAERGYALAHGAGDEFGAPVRARTAALAADTPAEDALRVIMQGCLEQIAGNAEGLLADADPEWVHQMRIGTRRLRSCLSLIPPTPGRDALIAEIKWLAQALGVARDWDVFAVDTLPPVVAALGTDANAAASFARLRRRVSARRGKARTVVRDAVRSARFTRLLLATGALCATPHYGRDDADALRALASPARTFAARLIDRRHGKLERKAAGLAEANGDDRHAARIAAKKLRYAAEFFAPLFSGKRARAYLKSLSDLQDVLGRANDAETVRHLLAGLAGAGDVAMEGAIRGWAAANTAALAKEIARTANRFATSHRFWIAG
jgi:inorganic triphosphatase YgiF